MRLGRIRWWAAATTAGLAVSTVAAAGGIPAASAASAGARAQLSGSAAPAAARSKPAGKVVATSQVSFDLVLSLQSTAGAENLLQEVSTPGSALFHHFLTDAQWVARFGPTQAQVNAAEGWLRSEGFSVGRGAERPAPGARLGHRRSGGTGLRDHPRQLPGQRQDRPTGQYRPVGPEHAGVRLSPA